MNFQDLKNIEDAQLYLDLAIKKAEEKASLLRQSIRLTSVSRTTKSKRIEIDKLRVIKEVLCGKLHEIYSKFPNLDNLPEFYTQIIALNLDVDKLKNALGSVSWAERTIKKVILTNTIKIKASGDQGEISKLGSSALGRISSIMKQINKFLKFIEESRKVMRNFPAVKTSLFTIAIAGFPNVGKSTLLSKLTSATPEIKTYAFTTKTLNMGYAINNYNKIQFIDTPGTLARFEKMNIIEKQAFLAMKYASQMIIYVFDLSETYSLEDQTRLLEQIQDIDKTILIYLSKTDIVDKKVVDKFIKGFDKDIKICLTADELFSGIENIEKDVFEE